MSKALFTLFALIFGLFGAFGVPAGFLAKGEEIPAESMGECVVEVSSRRILFEKEGEKLLPMASTTKILTAIIIIEDCPLQGEVKIPKEAEGVEGSSVYLKAGEVYTVEDLLYGLMLRSGNDCAAALALYHSGSIEDFAAVMNYRATLMGAQRSRFVNPHGLEDGRHRTSARDLALIASYAMQNETFRKIVSTRHYEKRDFYNKNKMLSSFEGAVGIKTGFTKTAGRCLVTGAERGGMTLVCVVLNSPKMYERSSYLLENAFSEYTMQTLCKGGEPFEGFMPKESFCYPLTSDERAQIKIEKELKMPLPEKQGDFAGVMKIYLKNSLIFSQNLYMM